jgi:hypothetical protein
VIKRRKIIKERKERKETKRKERKRNRNETILQSVILPCEKFEMKTNTRRR